MINKKFFNDLLKSYTAFNQGRREVIGYSSDALHRSKIAIFAMHRGQYAEAEAGLTVVEQIFNKIEGLFKKSPNLRHEGSYRAALEEYTEAKLFHQLSTTGKVGPIKEVQLDFDTYLAGLCDATGELVRLATKEATAQNDKEVEKIKDLMTDIMAELVEFNLTSYLRTKYDQARGNLRRIEQMIYEIKLRR